MGSRSGGFAVPAIGAQAKYAERMVGFLEIISRTDGLLLCFQRRVMKFNHLVAAGADQMIMVIPCDDMLIQRPGIANVQFLNQLGFA